MDYGVSHTGLTLLQRGRARAGAECRNHPAIPGHLHRRDFNGAAPARARNELDFLSRNVTLNPTSTGPRPRGRGMTGYIQQHMLSGPGNFNGAAPARARNVVMRFKAAWN